MTEQTAFDFLSATLGRPPFHQWLEPKLVAVDEAAGAVTIHLPLRQNFNRRPDEEGVHGGVLAAFVDIVGHAAIAARLRHGVPTIDLRIDYLRPAGGAELRGIGTIVRLGRTIGTVDVRIDDDRGRTVAVGRVAFLTRTGDDKRS